MHYAWFRVPPKRLGIVNSTFYFESALYNSVLPLLKCNIGKFSNDPKWRKTNDYWNERCAMNNVTAEREKR